jgi:hypothetical protein
VWWWRRSPTRVARPVPTLSEVVFGDDVRTTVRDHVSRFGTTKTVGKLLTTLGRTLSGIPDGPGRGAALAIGQRLVAHGQQMGSCVPVRVRAACVLVLLTGSRNSGARAHVHVPRACTRRVHVGVADQVTKFWGTRPCTCPGKVSVCSPEVSLISAQYQSAANLLSVGWEILGIRTSWTGVKVDSTWTRSLLEITKEGVHVRDQKFRDSGKGLDHEAQDTQDHRTVAPRRGDRRHGSPCSSFGRSARGKCGSN